MLWRAFGAPLPGSEIVRDLSENDFCPRTSERAEKTWSKKSGLPCFFFSPKGRRGEYSKSVIFVEDEAEPVAPDGVLIVMTHLTSAACWDKGCGYTNPEEAPYR